MTYDARLALLLDGDYRLHVYSDRARELLALRCPHLAYGADLTPEEADDVYAALEDEGLTVDCRVGAPS